MTFLPYSLLISPLQPFCEAAYPGNTTHIAHDNSQVPRLCLHRTGFIWIHFENGSRLTPSFLHGTGGGRGRGENEALRTNCFIG